MARIVIALGGNALQSNPKDISAAAQMKTVNEIVPLLADLVAAGNEILFTHGNGPQVGQIVNAYELAATVKSRNPVMPFPECGAMSQGYIGFQLQQAMRNELARRGIDKPIATVITQTIVDRDDPAFRNPTKPVGSFYTLEQAKELERTMGYVIKQDSNRGYRRVVPSPKPKKIVEEPVILGMLNAGFLVIACGGGGIPVVQKENGDLESVPAVIDKDFGASKLAEVLDADVLMILTAVDNVAVNFGKPDQRNLEKLTIREAEEYIGQGQFAPGSMLPKVQAAVGFVSLKPEKKAIIASLHNALGAVKGTAGTVSTASGLPSAHKYGITWKKPARAGYGGLPARRGRFCKSRQAARPRGFAGGLLLFVPPLF